MSVFFNRGFASGSNHYKTRVFCLLRLLRLAWWRGSAYYAYYAYYTYYAYSGGPPGSGCHFDVILVDRLWQIPGRVRYRIPVSFGVILVSFCCHFDVILMSFWSTVFGRYQGGSGIESLCHLVSFCIILLSF